MGTQSTWDSRTELVQHAGSAGARFPRCRLSSGSSPGLPWPRTRLCRYRPSLRRSRREAGRQGGGGPSGDHQIRGGRDWLQELLRARCALCQEEEAVEDAVEVGAEAAPAEAAAPAAAVLPLGLPFGYAGVGYHGIGLPALTYAAPTVTEVEVPQYKFVPKEKVVELQPACQNAWGFGVPCA